MKNPYFLLKETGLPVAYNHFKNEMQLPYLVYRGNGTLNFEADNIVYDSDYLYVVEYYYESKNEEVERQLEDLFNQHEIIWSKTEDVYIYEEDMYIIYYYLT